jgi:hypothetical protein
LADVAYHCCCLLEGLEVTEKAMGWSAWSGKIVLRIALQRLKRHYEEQGKFGPMIGWINGAMCDRRCVCPMLNSKPAIAPPTLGAKMNSQSWVAPKMTVTSKNIAISAKMNADRTLFSPK